MPFTMKDIETGMNQLAAENADLRREVGELREAMQDIRDALDHLPPPSRPIDESALSAKLTAVIDGRITKATTDITASVKKATKKSAVSSIAENGNLPTFLSGLALLFAIITPFLAVHFSSDITAIRTVETTTDKILWNQNYAGTLDKDGTPQTATPFTSNNKFYTWYNNQQSYINSQQQPQK